MNLTLVMRAEESAKKMKRRPQTFENQFIDKFIEQIFNLNRSYLPRVNMILFVHKSQCDIPVYGESFSGALRFRQSLHSFSC